MVFYFDFPAANYWLRGASVTNSNNFGNVNSSGNVNPNNNNAKRIAKTVFLRGTFDVPLHKRFIIF